MDINNLIDDEEIPLDIIDDLFSYLDYDRTDTHPSTWKIRQRITIKNLISKEKVPSQYAKEVFPWGIDFSQNQLRELKEVMACALIIGLNKYEPVNAISVFIFLRKNDLGLISQQKMNDFKEGSLIKELEFDSEDFYLKIKDLSLSMTIKDLYHELQEMYLKKHF